MLVGADESGWRLAEIAGRGWSGPQRFDPRRIPPQMLFLSVPASDVCNYRCRHCHIWTQSARPEPLSRSRRIELIEEFADLSPGGTVVLPGGEVFLDLAEFEALARACRKNGLAMVALTNGSRIQEPNTAERVARSGVTLISVSLDSHLPEIHNYTRGLSAAFAETTRAISLLAAARDRLGNGLRVIVTTVVFRDNLPLLANLVRFCRELGAQNLEIQLLARTFAKANRGRDVFFEDHFWHKPQEKEEAKRQFREFLGSQSTDGFVLKTPDDLPWIEAYIDDPDFHSSTPVCGSHHKNLIVEADGSAALCFNARQILDQPFVGNARDTSLRSIWTSARAGIVREAMDVCRLNCGALACHRRRQGDDFGAQV